MKFKDFKYLRPDIQKVQKEIAELSNLVGENKSLEIEIKAIHDYYNLIDDLETMETLVSIRNSVDTTDKFYEDEQEFFNENGPIITESSNNFEKRIFASKNRQGLIKEFGELLFKQIEQSLKTFQPEIIPDLQLENKLRTEYQKVMSSAKIKFQGGVYNLSQMTPFTQDLDRETRHSAQLAISSFLEEKETDIDRIYDELVKVRTLMASKLGYENFVQLGYDRLGRTDYNALDVASYRKQVFEEIVPLTTELVARKTKRIGITNPKSYDLTLSFKSGNPTPKGDRAWLVDKAQKMYEELSPETGKFFNGMIDLGVLELDSKPGKSGGGYCTFIPEYNTPYIFANFNGTQHDVEVLTHEAGHAFQIYQSRALLNPYRWPTLEACEIHSMSMEFITWPWMKNFFLEDTDKFKFNHLSGSIEFLPYGVSVDEFQHEIYENPTMSPAERKAAWRRIEKKYLPFKDYGDDAFMEKGTRWFRQGHIFGSPFYYIDYTLAQVCALQYWIKSRENHEETFKNYLSLCKLGGSQSFVNLMNSVGLKNPFIQGTVKEIVAPIKAYLNTIDDSKL
ncbi:MAG: M3 family oligoendopeptidase [Tenericutes bacterium]|nr:M3 family oligoendopeptidase [Mycoplasmatota bacterium]